MCPNLPFGGFEIHAYALFTWVGALAACLLALPALKRAGMTASQSWTSLFLMCVSFLVCARLWNVAVNPANYLGSFKWYTPKLAGLSLYGGLIGAAAVLILFAKARRIRILPVLDAMVVPGGVAFCLARVGCFLNGCCSGKATSSPFGVLFPDRGRSEQIFSPLLPFLKNQPVHPTQLYELAGAAIGLLAVLLVGVAILRLNDTGTQRQTQRLRHIALAIGEQRCIPFFALFLALSIAQFAALCLILLDFRGYSGVIR